MSAATLVDLRAAADNAQVVFEHHQGNVRALSREIVEAMEAGKPIGGLVEHRKTASDFAARSLTVWTAALDALDAARVLR